MFSPDQFLSSIRELRGRREYQTLTGVNKTVVKYILTEAEDLVNRDLIAYGKYRKSPTKIALFTLEFGIYTGLHVWTIHKSGAARIKCINECKKEQIPGVVDSIEAVCKVLGWNLESDTQNHVTSDKRISISYNA